MNLTLRELRDCFEGAIPSSIATCALDGTPNVALLSQVHFVDDFHVALSFQFFNTTRKNILANPQAVAHVVDPSTAAHYRLQLRYLRTETEGPLFEKMKAKLAGIASHTGMSKVFRLQGSDVYEVLHIEHVFGCRDHVDRARLDLLSGLRHCISRLAECRDLSILFDTALQGLAEYCDIQHAMLLMFDPDRDRLYTVATHGYRESGIGSEIRVGEGIIGVAARERTPVRIGHAAQEYLYSRAMREGFAKCNAAEALETEIPIPGLADSGSQIAVPLILPTARKSRLLGILYLESPKDMRFGYEEEDALVALADYLALAIELHNQSAEAVETNNAIQPESVKVQGALVTVRHYAVDHSVFIGSDYLIKGVAGAIIWKLLCAYAELKRTEFSNRELRLDPALRLPDISDNLEARLVLLQRRLAERCTFIAIEKTGRGRFRLNISRPLQLDAIAGA